MQHTHRGHLIRLVGGAFWRAELIEIASGAMLPTSVMASEHEGFEICAARARDLIDLYLDAQRKLAPVRSPAPLRLVETTR